MDGAVIVKVVIMALILVLVIVTICTCNKFMVDRKSTRLNSSHPNPSRMPSSA